ncbi:DUF2147 domain-containing protein [Qipengyuania sp. ASV99]|uniref:DUF2147 domain-containing protein n=1 Tax=Qipengyuania sp. ASV99 TaxID=3399681 RepID=UPI003A4C58EC
MIARIATGLAAMLTAVTMIATPANAAEAITGRWITAERDAIVEIRPCGNATCGTIARFLVPPPDGADQRDIYNPDPNLKTRRLLGLPILTQFREESDLWRGRIYDPKTGKSYRSVIRRTSANTIEVRGCIGPFCQSQVWRRSR